MPKISEFYGILIYMYVDHNPPHIHISYKNEVYRFNIIIGDFIDTKAPTTLKKLIKTWYNMHKKELLEVWNMLQTNGKFKTIEPLK